MVDVNLVGLFRSVDMARNVPVGNCIGYWRSVVMIAFACFWSQLTARSSVRGEV